MRFHYLLLSFVISMIFLIIRPNLLRVLLGWDGLGISSYLLVIYYARPKSYNAGIITFLSNRVGDALIIARIRYFIFIRTLNLNRFTYRIDNFYFWAVILIVVAACTKRAQIPFSAWLPAAMAAPTPVSSLVHSSTLVTAGVYLIFRFEKLLVYFNINQFLLVLGSLTILIARLRAFFEIDIKKIVALSTLSQLGVIITAIGAGFGILGFFHLLTHAFFKALLFIRSGNLIHASERYQDLRVIGGASEVIPFSKSIVIRCSFSLCGLPFMSAFFSKEMIIESLLVFNLSFIRYFIIILGIFITIFYRIRFLIISVSWINRQRSVFNKSDSDYYTNFRIVVLVLPAIIGGRFIYYFLGLKDLFLVRAGLKYLGLFLLSIRVLLFFLFFLYNILLFKAILWGIGSLWILPLFSSRIFLRNIFNVGDYFHKISDYSWTY